MGRGKSIPSSEKNKVEIKYRLATVTNQQDTREITNTFSRIVWSELLEVCSAWLNDSLLVSLMLNSLIKLT